MGNTNIRTMDHIMSAMGNKANWYKFLAMEQLNHESKGNKAKRNKSHRYGEQKVKLMEKNQSYNLGKTYKKT
jgi:hypothetical protein